MSYDFVEYRAEHVIGHEVIICCTPQHNGIAEKRNRIIVDMAWSMLKAKVMPNYFWDDAVLCSVYLLNRSPTKKLEDVTPKEAWSDSNHMANISRCLV